MSTPRPQLLYHYTKLGVALEHILVTGQLRLSPLSAMRDPRESKEWLPTHGGSDAEWAWPEGAFEEFHVKLREAKRRIKVLSLTENWPDVDPDAFDETGCGYAHPRLWEQYGDAHRGVCLGFERPALVEQLFDELRSEGTPMAGPVEYTDDPLIPGVTAKTVVERGVDGAVDYLIEKRLRELIFRKTTDWESEVEYLKARIPLGGWNPEEA